MIPIELLGDGSVADRNFQKLRQFVPDTGGLSIRIRFGAVTAAGDVHAGSGFTAVQNGTGDYTVTVGFSTVPAVIVGTGETNAFYVAKLHASTPPSVTEFRVFCYDPDTLAAVDGIFHWFAIG